MDKIYNNSIPDSDIIWETESAKCNDPEFDINWTDNNGWSSLISAVLQNRIKLVEYLLTCSGLNVNLRDKDSIAFL